LFQYHSSYYVTQEREMKGPKVTAF
jgi:hypothetical protein